MSEHFPKLTLLMFDKGTDLYPMLRGKAVHCKTIGPALLYVWKKIMGQSERHRVMKMALERCVRMDQLVDETRIAGEYKMPEQEHRELVKITHEFLSLNTVLNHEFKAQVPTRQLFPYTIKFHYLIHIAQKAQYLHPGLTWCYGGESYLKHCKRYLQSKMRGTKTHAWNNRAIEQYCEGMHCKFSHGRPLFKATPKDGKA